MNKTHLLVGVIVLFLNVPFGYWRANVRRLSPQWYLAIHLPVPVVVVLRVLTGLGWRVMTFPFLAASFLLGQFIGGTLHRLRRRRHEEPLTSCLVMDLIRSCRYPWG